MYSTRDIGLFIQEKRQNLKLTQAALSEALNVSPQAVSKWERGESLPDTALLVPLAKILNTSTDVILTAGKGLLMKKGMVDLIRIKKGVQYLSELKDLIGTENTVYRYMSDGITQGMNTPFEMLFEDDYKQEALVVEIALQQVMNGFDLDLGSIDYNLKHEHWRNILKRETRKYTNQ